MIAEAEARIEARGGRARRHLRRAARLGAAPARGARARRAGRRRGGARGARGAHGRAPPRDRGDRRAAAAARAGARRADRAGRGRGRRHGSRSSFADVERRQVEKLQRIVAREGERYAEAASQQFDADRQGSAREEAAGRLVTRARPRGRDVRAPGRRASSPSGSPRPPTPAQQRLEARLRQAQSAFERQRDELSESFAQRVAEADADLRRTLGAFVAEAEAERPTLEARLAELARRVDCSPTASAPR